MNKYNYKFAMRLLAATLLLLSPLSGIQAAVIDISSLSVDTVSTNLVAIDTSTNTTVIDTGATVSLIPPAELLMGTFQSSILDFSTAFTGGSLTATVYSDPALNLPNASVDTTAGNFSSIDLSSLKIQGTVFLDDLGTSLNFDTGLWPVTTMPTSSFYDSLTGDFSLSWAFNDILDFTSVLATQSLDTTLDFTISGTATVVPVPAALWLFLSGMLGLAGFLNKKK